MAVQAQMAYAEDDVALLSSAGQVAIAVDDVLSQVELQHAQDRLKLLLELTNSVVFQFLMQVANQVAIAVENGAERSSWTRSGTCRWSSSRSCFLE